MKSYQRLSAGFILIVVGVVLSLAGLLLLLQHDQFRAATTVSAGQALHDAHNGEVYDPYFILTEFETIQSHAVLGKVATEFDLHDVWGKKYNHGQKFGDSAVEDMLKRRLRLRMIANTSFIEIAVIDDNPSEAAALANSIAKMYCQFKDEQRHDLSAHGLSSLKLQLQETEEKAQTAKAEVEKLKADLQISDSSVFSNDPPVASYFEAKRKFADLSQTVALISTRLAEQTSPDSVPRPMPVIIVSLATIPTSPFRPRSLAVAITVCGLLLAVAGVYCLRSAES